MLSLFRRLARDVGGASAVECTLIVSLIANRNPVDLIRGSRIERFEMGIRDQGIWIRDAG